MSTPDPRLDEIQARAERAAEWPVRNIADEDRAFLLAELRKAHEALERVETLHKESAHGGCEECERVVEESISGDGQYRMSNWPCPTVEALRAAVAAAKGDGEDA